MSILWVPGLLALLLACGGVIYQRLGLRRDRRLLPPPGRLVDVGGHRLHAVCGGTGRPGVLLESGIAASSLSWAVVRPALAAVTHACAYDRAGLAWSDPPSSARTAPRIVDELGILLGRLAPGARWVLVGHSFGSYVVRAHAARHPESVAGLVLIDPPAAWLAAGPERDRLLRGGRQLSRIGAVLAHVGVVRACLSLLTGGAPGVPRRFVQVFGRTAARTLERLVGEVRKLPSAAHPAVQAHWCQARCFHAMAAHMRTLELDGAWLAAQVPPRDVPVVVISGGDAKPAQLGAHRALVETSAAGRHVVAEGSAHWVQFDRPGLVVDLVRELVERDRARCGIGHHRGP